jgi:hypothetical protein
MSKRDICMIRCLSESTGEVKLQTGRRGSSSTLQLCLKSFLFFAIACLMLLPANAQFAGKGSLLGLVTDPTGAVLPDATITVTNTATGVVITRKSSATGYYNIAPLDAGIYTVSVAVKGFKTARQENVQVNATQQVGLNLVLNPGGEAETVVVTSAPPQLDTASASLDTTVDNAEYTELPLQMSGTGAGSPRDPVKFISIVPGVTIANTSSQYSSSIFGGSGSQGRLDEVYYDGMPVTSLYVQGDSRAISNSISVEAVDQFQVITGVIPAQYQGIGVQNYTVRSGSSQLHGSVFEYFRNTALDTWGFFNPWVINSVKGKAIKPVEHQNEFGGRVGGSALRNKLHFFGSYDAYRYSAMSSPSYATIPTQAERSGDFRAYQNIYDPTSTNCTSGICTRTQISYNNVNNVMNPASISSVASKLQSLLPKPTNDELTNNYLGSFATSQTTWATTNKVDWTFNDKHKLAVIFAMDEQGTPSAVGYGNPMPLPYEASYIWHSKNPTLIVEDNYVIRPNLVNSFHYGYFRFWGPVENPSEDKAYGLGTLGGMKNLPSGQATNAFPNTSFSDGYNLASWAGGKAYNTITNNYTIQDDLQYIHGRHSVSFGFLHQWLELNSISWTGGGTSPVYLYFNSAQTAAYDATGKGISNTGNAYASFLYGATNQGILYDYSAFATTGARSRPTSLYVQDDYKASQRLTLNLGLRWDYYPPSTEVLGRYSWMNPNIANPSINNYNGALQFAGSGTYGCNCDTPINKFYKNFGPRVGAAYQLNERTVIRGGFGLSYTHATGVTGVAALTNEQLGYAANPNFVGQNGQQAFMLDDGFPSYTKGPFISSSYNTGGTVNYIDPVTGARAPYVESWSLGIERMINSNLVLHASYVGSEGHYLPVAAYGHPGRGRWSNQLNPKYFALENATVNGSTVNLLGAEATTANIAAAQKIVSDVALPYASYTGTIAQMLRPFPQYSGVNDVGGNVSNSNYQAFQFTAKERMSHGLSLTVNYTLQREYDDNGTYRSAYLPAYVDRSAGTTDARQVMNVEGVYVLPFTSKSVAPAIVKGAFADWRLAGIYSYQTGTPIVITMNGCSTLYYQGTCAPDLAPGYAGNGRVNGGWGKGVTATNTTTNFIDTAAFSTPYNQAFGNAPRTAPFNLRGPSMWDIDMSLKRDITLHDRIKLTFDVSAYNLTNSVVFAIGNTTVQSTTPGQTVDSSTALGRVTGQANSPRDIQLSARINF